MLSVDAEMGGFRNWAAGSPWENWRTSRPSNLTPEQREEILKVGREATAKRLADEKALREHARLMAGAMWGRAEESGHPYLDRKGICSNGSRVLGELLLIPVRDWDGELHSVQKIPREPNGLKLFLTGGRTKGYFHWIRVGQQTGPMVYVAEGFATGSTIHAATGGKPVVVAFSAGNLLPVCRVLRDNLPRVVLVVCADNDHRTEGNPGVTAATAAAIEVGARLAIPKVAGSDFNDLQAEQGIAEVKRQLSATVKPRKAQEGAKVVDGF
ncbi:MAG TPA: toprim domain-containing protein [Polyangia bacterium]|nr:toprim domain-containing protein [Polyangia bacterium]